MRHRIRVGSVPYLNAKPLVCGIERGLGADRIDLRFEVPSRLAAEMAAGSLDLALLPTIELGRIPGLVVAPGLGISTRGPAASVLLVAQRPIEQVRSVALDPESRTSNALVQVLFAEAWDLRPSFGPGPRDVAESLDRFDAVVRIGDKALFEALPPGAEALDLGAAWTHFTGLPFVFAVWAARDGILDRELYEVLHASRREGTRLADTIAADYTWNGRRWPEISREYLRRHIFYRLGAVEVQAMERFLASAVRLGLADHPGPVRLASFRDEACRGAGRDEVLPASREERGTP